MSADLYELLAKGPFREDEKRKIRKDIDASRQARNAELPFFSSSDYSVAPDLMNVYGWVNKDGDMFMAKSRDAGDYANTLGHEAFHQRLKRHPEDVLVAKRGLPWGSGVRAAEMRGRDLLWDNMCKIGKEEDTDRYWGRNWSRSAEELYASLFGYEAALPKGTPITESPLASRLFGGNPRAINTYFTETSRPYGGVWEGQVPEKGPLERVSEALRRWWRR